MEPPNEGHSLIDRTADIHPTARIDPTARIGPNARIEADVIVGPHCVVGAGTRLRTRCILVEHVSLGEHNDVHPYAVIGGDPQDRTFDEARRGEAIIGDRNIIREHVTIHRGNWNGPPTRIGSRCYLMTLSHLGHNAAIGDNVTMANGAALAGHARVGSNVVMSAYTLIHQFTMVGDGVMFRGGAAVGMHVPPYVMVAGENTAAGLNVVGLRRNPSVSQKDRDELKEVYRHLLRTRGARPVEEIVAFLRRRPWGPHATAFIDFCETAVSQEPPRNRGLIAARRMQIRERSASSVATEP